MKILLVENNHIEAERLKQEFSCTAPHIGIEWVATFAEGEARLDSCTPDNPLYDVIVTDMELPDGSGTVFAPFLKERQVPIAVVVLAEPEDKALVVAALKAGANNYVIKQADYLAVLPGILEKAAHHSQTMKNREVSKTIEAYYRSVLNNITDLIMITDINNNISYVSPSFERVLGYTDKDIRKMNPLDFVHPDDRLLVADSRMQTMLNPGVTGPTIEVRLRHEDGSWLYVEATGKMVLSMSGQMDNVITIHDITSHKQIEEELKKKEESFRALVEKSSEVIALLDHDYKRVYVSQNVEAFFGYTVEEFLSRNRDDYIHPDYVAISESNRRWAKIHPGETVTFLSRLRHKNGSWRWIEVTARNLLHDPAVGASVINYRDVTERKEAADALLWKTAFLEAQVSSSPDGILVVDEKGRKILQNPKMRDLWGIPEDIFNAVDDTPELQHVMNMTKYPQQFYEKVMDLYSHHNRTSRDEIELKDGRVFDRYTAPVLGKDGQYYGRIWTFRDMTARKQIETELEKNEERLRESEAKYRNVVERSLVGFYIVQDDRFRFVNKRFCEIIGYPHEEIVGKLNPIDIVHPDDRKMAAENLGKRLLDGEVEYVEHDLRIRRRDGQIVTVRSLGSSMLYNGRPAATGSIVDITREKTLEAQLRQAQKMEAIGTLAGGVAHDFNNMLTIVAGYATLLQASFDANDPLRIYTDEILSAAQKATLLTGSLLTFSRQQNIAFEPIEINAIIRDTKRLLKRLLVEDITLTFTPSSGHLTIMGNATHIDQILFNLVTNARDAMPRGGTISVKTRQVELEDKFPAIHGFDRPGSYALVSVSDTGAGMDAETTEHIFDPFFTTKEVGKGTGLGLSIIYGIVQQHDGYITVYSEPGVGTTFHIYLPLAEAVAQKNKADTESIQGGKETILVAEDSKEVRHLVRFILGKYGYTIIEAVDGEDAVAKFKEGGNIDLLILDSVMPKKNGRAVYDEIAAMDKEIKVLFTSGYTRDIILDRGIEDQKFDFISKPLLPKELLTKVREILDRNR